MAKSKQKIKGSIYQNRLGKWVAIFDAGTDDFGKRKRKQESTVIKKKSARSNRKTNSVRKKRKPKERK